MDNLNQPISLTSFHVDDPFWKTEMELVRTKVIPYQWNALNDNVPGAEPSFCMHNYKVAGKLNEARKIYGESYGKPEKMPTYWGGKPEDSQNPGDGFYGFVFQDSDFSKWVEAVAYSLTQHPDPELEKTADEAIEIVCKAQLPNGYLDTYFIICDFDKAFTNVKDAHELYCLGHLVEGAVAYYEATGKDKLLKAACRYADYVDLVFGPEEGKKKGYPGHEIAEMALVRLYRVTGEKRYLNLAKFFVDERGKRPYFFDSEVGAFVPKGEEDKERYTYHQANKPVREQQEALGHAVRAVYLYSGMADIARLTGDADLKKACERLWDDIENKKMYITGGIGATHLGEAFSFAYDLPNDTAYSETCASIGLMFFARRMLEMHPCRKYADVMERALYNVVLSGMALDGQSFFYVNPLESFPEACHKDERKFHVKSVRQKWFGCACCPPNIARLLSSIVSYAYTENEKTLFMHLYIGGTFQKKFKQGDATFRITSGLPWNGTVKIEALNETPVEGELALRMPGWGALKTLPDGASEKDGYLYLTRAWKKGETVELSFAMEPTVFMANTRVREDSGKVALMRGPLVYCLEEADNGKNLQNVLMELDKPITMEKILIAGEEMVALKASGVRIKETPEDGPLYIRYSPVDVSPVELTFVPYFAWNNRGEGEMVVWL